MNQDTKRLDYLASLIELGTARILYNDDEHTDEDDWGEVPVGYSIRIRACQDADYSASTLREVIDAAMEMEELAKVIDENGELFIAAIICFACEQAYEDSGELHQCQRCNKKYYLTMSSDCPECGCKHYDMTCPQCESTDIVYLSQVIANWDDYVEEAERERVLASTKALVKTMLEERNQTNKKDEFHEQQNS